MQTAGRSPRDPGVDARLEGEAECSCAIAGSSAEDQSDAGERHCYQRLKLGHRQTRVYWLAQERRYRPDKRRSQLQHDSHRLLNLSTMHNLQPPRSTAYLLAYKCTISSVRFLLSSNSAQSHHCS